MFYNLPPINSKLRKGGEYYAQRTYAVASDDGCRSILR